MALTQIWPFFIVGAAVLAAVAIGFAIGRVRASHAAEDAQLVSRAERLREMPSVRRATRRRAVALGAVVALGIVAALVSSVVAARPMASQTIVPESTSRDIMLCLDVSGSMIDADKEVLDIYLELLDGFEGERIGLTIFNSSPVQIFPLTDDYEFVRQHLTAMRDSFEYSTITPEHWVGTFDGPGSSLIGDGLAACALRFDHDDEDRSRSIILATDNEPLGPTVLTVNEAAAYAAANSIRVYAVNPIHSGSAVAQELAEAARGTGGEAYALRGTTTVADIIDEVQQQEATALRGEIQVVWTDEPTIWVVILLVFTLVSVTILWRVRL